VLDLYGNPVSQAAVTFTAPSGGASASFAGSGCTSSPQTYACVATTDSTGRATSSTLTANATAGTYTVAAAASGLSASYTETNTSAGVLHVSSLVTGTPTGTTTWGSQLTVAVTDAGGGPVAGVTVTGAWSPTSSVATTGCTTLANGTCTITPANGSFPSGQAVETWTVSNLSAAGYLYDATSNVASSLTVGRGCAAGAVCSYPLNSTFDVTTGTTATTVTATGTNGIAPANATVYVLVARDGKKAGDSVSNVAGTAISSPALVSSITSNLRSTKQAATNLWVYAANGTGTASGTVGVTFNNADNIGTLVQAVVVAGDNTAATTWAAGTTSCTTTTCTTAATASLTSPASTSGELILIGQASATKGSATPTGTGQTSMFSGSAGNSNTGFFTSTWSNTAAKASTGFTLPTAAAPWGVIAVEVPQTR
jgi:hypothetical protein